MNVPGGGKNDIPNRLKRQFAIFNVPQPSTDALNNIFGALVQARHPARAAVESAQGASLRVLLSICSIMHAS